MVVSRCCKKDVFLICAESDSYYCCINCNRHCATIDLSLLATECNNDAGSEAETQEFTHQARRTQTVSLR